jgi:hypothetical protein
MLKTMKGKSLFLAALLALGSGAAGPNSGGSKDVNELTRQIWPPERIQQAIQDLDRQKRDRVISDEAYARRKKMLNERLAGTYRPESLSVADPPLNFVQNGGFELTNPNSDKNRSRWLWWGGWSWGGDYENMWEQTPAFVHSGKYSARIRCTGATGRIGINTPPLPAVPGVTEYKLTFWARGEGENMLFVNFEEGAQGELRQRIGEDWKQLTLPGKPVEGAKTYNFYFYSIGAGTIWLDDVELVPVGGKLDE